MGAGETGLTERQKKWFASVRASLAASTGRTVEDWVAVARACPETAHRKRLAWLKSEHGLGVNYGSFVLSQAFASDPGSFHSAARNPSGSSQPGPSEAKACDRTKEP